MIPLRIYSLENEAHFLDENIKFKWSQLTWIGYFPGFKLYINFVSFKFLYTILITIGRVKACADEEHTQ